MLKAGPHTGGAAAVARIEAEGSRPPALYFGSISRGEKFPDRVKSADVTHGIRAGGFSDRGLVNKVHPLDQIKSLDVLIGSRGLSRNAEPLLERWDKHFLGERRLPGAGHTGEAGEAVKRERDIDIAEIIRGDPGETDGRCLL